MSNLFFDLPERERLWLVNYYKLRGFWQHMGYSLEGFPRLRDGPIINRPPWSDRHHPLNRKLEEVEEVVQREYGQGWRRFQGYRVEYHFITDLKEVI